MFLYKIELNKNYYKLKDVEEYDIYRSAIIVASDKNNARKIAFENFNGAEVYYDFNIKNSRYSSKYNNNIWLNEKYTDIYKIGIPIKKYSKDMIITIDFNAG